MTVFLVMNLLNAYYSLGTDRWLTDYIEAFQPNEQIALFGVDVFNSSYFQEKGIRFKYGWINRELELVLAEHHRYNQTGTPEIERVQYCYTDDGELFREKYFRGETSDPYLIKDIYYDTYYSELTKTQKKLRTSVKYWNQANGVSKYEYYFYNNRLHLYEVDLLDPQDTLLYSERYTFYRNQQVREMRLHDAKHPYHPYEFCSYRYDSSGNIELILIQNEGSSALSGLSFEYGRYGQLLSETKYAVQLAWADTYDRLTPSFFNYHGYVIQHKRYMYDPAIIISPPCTDVKQEIE